MRASNVINAQARLTPLLFVFTGMREMVSQHMIQLRVRCPPERKQTTYRQHNISMDDPVGTMCMHKIAASVHNIRMNNIKHNNIRCW